MDAMSNPSVVEYVVQRLAALGIEHVFGVPGDYAFPFDDAIESSAAVTWVADANELNAAYAADGYARIRGAAIMCTTYAVGELSALNGVMGSKAEHLPVFHLVGQPSTRLQRGHRIVHHSFGDGVFGNFQPSSWVSACAYTNLTPENTVAEMERVIAEALANRQPAYIAVAEDYAYLPVQGEPVAGIPLSDVPPRPSDPHALDEAVDALLKRLKSAKHPVVLAAYTVGRYGLQQGLEKFLAASGLPYATTPMDKAVISESHPQFLGMYSGPKSGDGVRETVEGADLVLNLGGVVFSDINTMFYMDAIDPACMVTVWPDYVEVGDTTFSPLSMADVLRRLAEATPKFATPAISSPVAPVVTGDTGDLISSASFYSRLHGFLRPRDIVVAETGMCTGCMAAMHLPDGAAFHNQSLWASIGWATGAALGTSLADPRRRTVLVTGDGAHQMTANEIGAMGRAGVKPVIFVLNNGMYGLEEILSQHEGHDYDRLAPWEYHLLPKALGCKDWFTARVTTNAELDAALTRAGQQNDASYIEVVLQHADIGPSLPRSLTNRIYETT
jgi:indolepyruvate decarboxylase